MKKDWIDYRIDEMERKAENMHGISTKRFDLRERNAYGFTSDRLVKIMRKTMIKDLNR